MHKRTDSRPRPPRKQGSLSRGLSTLVLLLLASCPGREQGATEEQVSPRTVSVANVQRGDLVETVSLIGELQGVEEVRVLAMVTDRIRRLAVREGDTVRAGDVLAILSSDITSRAMEQADAGLEAAVSNRDALEREVSRIKPLVEAGSAPRSQLEALETQLRAASAQVRQATAGAGQAAVQQGRTVVRTPIAGVVTNLMQQEGEIAAPSIPLLTVVRSDRLKAVVRAPERHFLRIREGMNVTVSPIAGPTHHVRATVSLKGPVVDRMTRTGLVEVEIDNPDGTLVPGSMVRVVIEIERKPDVLLAPAEAVIFTTETEHTGRALIFMADGDEARRRQIVVGSRQDGMIEVRDGLAHGELIVTRGAQFLRDGNPIRWNATSSEHGPHDRGSSQRNDGAGAHDESATTSMDGTENGI